MRRRAALPGLVASIALLGWGACAPTAVEDGAVCVAEGRPGAMAIAAGTGVGLPLLRAVPSLQGAGVAWWVPESIGSRGALAAVADGAIDAGCISLLAGEQPPTEHQGVSLASMHLGRSRVSFHAHANVPVQTIAADTLRDLLAGRQRQWSDGQPVVLVVREPGDTSERLLGAWDASLPPLLDTARAEGRVVVALTDQEAAEAITGIPGAFGLLDEGLVAAASTAGTGGGAHRVQVAAWPAAGLRRDVVLVWRTDAPAAVLQQIDWLRTAPGRALRAQHLVEVDHAVTPPL